MVQGGPSGRAMQVGEATPATGLEILDDPCRGCGACCEYVGAPPGYAPAYSTEEGEEATEDWWQTEDGRTLRAMPAEVRAILDAYYRSVRAGIVKDREVQADPCIWYDPAARRCSHYEWRPSACRAFEAGGDDCRGIKEYAGR